MYLDAWYLQKWALKKAGIPIVDPVITAMNQEIQSCTTQFSPRFVVIPRDSPPKKRAAPAAKAIPAVTESDSEEFVDESEADSAELEASESDSRSSSRLVTRSALRKMQIDEDDMLITTKRGARSARQVFINVTRLQEFIRAEGQSVENDPFMRYLGRLPAELFVSGAGMERARDAAMRVQGNRGTSAESGGNEGSVGSRSGRSAAGKAGKQGTRGGSRTEKQGSQGENGGNQGENGGKQTENSGNQNKTPIDNNGNQMENGGNQIENSGNQNQIPIENGGNSTENRGNPSENQNQNQSQNQNQNQPVDPLSGNGETQNPLTPPGDLTAPTEPPQTRVEPRGIPVLLNSINQTDSSAHLSSWKFRGFEPTQFRAISFHSLHSHSSPLPAPANPREVFPAGDSPSISHALAKFEGILARRSDCGRSFHVIERFFAKLFATGPSFHVSMIVEPRICLEDRLFQTPRTAGIQQDPLFGQLFPAEPANRLRLLRGHAMWIFLSQLFGASRGNRRS